MTDYYTELIKALDEIAAHCEETDVVQILTKAADAIEELQQKYIDARIEMERQMCRADGGKWISVEERLPKNGEKVHLYFERNAWNRETGKTYRKKNVETGWCWDGRWHVDGCSGVDGIKWMPINWPEPPKEEA